MKPTIDLRRVCIVPRVSGVGGMVSFQHKLVAALQQQGVLVSYDLADRPYQAVLVIGGTRDLSGLGRARRQGIPVVQRLDGMNWLHRHLDREPSAWRHYLRAEYGNFILRLIRRRLASRVVYQSLFVRRWWEQQAGPTPVPGHIIYIGVDLDVYTPYGPEQPPRDCWRILMVEGSLMGGYEQGLEAAVGLLERLAGQPGIGQGEGGRPVELRVVGRVAASLQQAWDERLRQHCPPERGWITWAGLAGREDIPAIDRAAHCLYSSDINAACPNSVIEALACGLPVLAFDTGALPELVPPEAGRVVAYGGDPWKLEPPDLQALAAGASEILTRQAELRRGARRRAQAAFSLQQMLQAYLDVLQES